MAALVATVRCSWNCLLLVGFEADAHRTLSVALHTTPTMVGAPGIGNSQCKLKRTLARHRVGLRIPLVRWWVHLEL